MLVTKCKKIHSVLNILSLLSGTYLYIETSAPSITGDSAVLMSQIFPPVDALCFHFFYSMYGATTGTLRIWLVEYDSDALTETNRKVLWELNGNQGNLWLEGVTQIDRQLSSYRVRSKHNCFTYDKCIYCTILFKGYFAGT